MALPSSVSEIAVSPAEDKVFYLSNAGDELTEGVVADFSNKSQKKIFELPFGEFNISWPTKDNIVLLTKPSVKAEGYLYFLNQKTGVLTRIFGGIKGLAAVVSPDGEKIIFSGIGQDGTESKVYNVKTKTISELGFATLADKCAWGKKNKNTIYCAVPTGRQAVSAKKPDTNQPDGWYQGLVSFDDGVWSKNIATGESQNILSRFGADIANIFVSDGENHLIFTDKNDGTLWTLKLTTVK